VNFKLSWIVIKEEMTDWQWRKLDHVKIVLCLAPPPHQSMFSDTAISKDFYSLQMMVKLLWTYPVMLSIFIFSHTHTHPFNGPLSGTTRVSRYQKGKSNLDFTEARDSEWQWHHLGYMQVCTSLQTDNHASTPPLSFLQAGCPSCRPTNSVKALFIIQASNAILYWVQSC